MQLLSQFFCSHIHKSPTAHILTSLFSSSCIPHNCSYVPTACSHVTTHVLTHVCSHISKSTFPCSHLAKVYLFQILGLPKVPKSLIQCYYAFSSRLAISTHKQLVQSLNNIKMTRKIRRQYLRLSPTSIQTFDVWPYKKLYHLPQILKKIVSSPHSVTLALCWANSLRQMSVPKR